MLSNLAPKLDRQRYRMAAWFLAGDGPLTSELAAAGYNVHTFDWRLGARQPLQAFRFFSKVKAEAPTIVHQHYGGRSVRKLAKWASQSAIIVHLHGRVSEALGPTPIETTLIHADAVLAVSRAVAETVAGTRVEIVYPGLQISQGAKRGLKNGPIVLGSAGRLVPIKGFVDLLWALALLRSEFPDLSLEIAGDGDQRAALLAMVEALGLAGTVRFLGWQSHLAEIFSRWDIFVAPSLEESFSIVTLEAMVAGLPVVASDVGGLRELIRDGQTGYLVAPAAPGLLALALCNLIRDAPLRMRIGAAARRRAEENFTSAQMAAKISEIYERVLRERADQSAQRT